mmetsp:Transcript_17427/g.30166  ORF Transcript_17427/g.30166 Transcript_17427/m.30166 type:complete len:82 (-) Transcript_17427:770-1015(-)
MFLQLLSLVIDQGQGCADHRHAQTPDETQRGFRVPFRQPHMEQIVGLGVKRQASKASMCSVNVDTVHRVCYDRKPLAEYLR